MGKVKAPDSSKPKTSKMRPALTPEAKENQMISLAMDLVEQRLRDGTATSQETTHFLKLATSKSKLELKYLEAQTEVAIAKKEALKAQQHSDEVFAEAMKAFKEYSGHGGSDEDDYEY